MRIVDSHSHLSYGNPGKLIEMADFFGFEKIAVMAIPMERNPLNTLECMLMKRLAPERVYVYGGMAYFKNAPATKESHVKQLELMMNAGCDGWKLLESKPSVYRNLQIPLDSDVFDGAFSMAEAEGIPVTWHAGDPATFWSADTAPEFAVRNKWLCVGEGFPKLHELYTQVENVFKKHPKLRASLAHLYFTSDDRPHAERMLENYENFFMDITPGSEMYYAFLADPEGWTKFFEKWQDKIVFGTDMEDDMKDIVFGSQEAIYGLVVNTLIGDKYFEGAGAKGTGLGLKKEVVQKIFAENFEKRAGKTPKALSESGLNAYIEWLMPKLTKEDREKAEKLLMG
ncbi:MAG: hypothetical protein E7322_11535 [Clostridiales bacterium]|nr:hypothetical protein [Clostridiales bacterium]